MCVFILQTTVRHRKTVFTFTITAKDIAGKQTSISRRITVDTDEPEFTEIKINDEALASWYNTTVLNVSVTVSDGDSGSGVQSVYWESCTELN